MMSGTVVEILRLSLVIALIIFAGVLATPPGRLPLALRGVLRILRKDDPSVKIPASVRAATWKRILSFILVIVAFLLAVMSASAANRPSAAPKKGLFPGVYGPKDPMPKDRQKALEEMSAIEPATAEVRKTPTGPELFIDGKRSCFCGYRGDYDFKMTGDSGGDLVIVEVMLYRDLPWLKALWRKDTQAFDFKPLEDKLLRVHNANPRARVIVSVCTDPDRAWEEAHPESLFLSPMGKRGRVELYGFRGFSDKPIHDKTDRTYWAYSYSSEEWQEYAEEGLEELCEWIGESPAGNIVVGFNIGGGMDGQFVQWEYKPAHGHFDYGEANRAALGEYLDDIYFFESDLREAWDDQEVTFETVRNPTPEEFKSKRFFTDVNGLDRKICDCRRFVSDSTARAINRLARAAKDSFGRDCVVSVWWTTAIWAQPSRLSIDELVKDHAVDIIQTVSYYGANRAVGGVGASANNTAASMAQRGILWIQELDHRTRRTEHSRSKSMMSAALPRTPEEFEAQVLRDASSVLAVGGRGYYFYDMQGSWYHEKEAQSTIRLAYSMNRFVRDHAGLYRQPEVAIVMDEKTRLVGETLSYDTPNSLWRMSGLMPALHLLTDIEREDFPKYRLLILWQAITITREQIDIVRRMMDEGTTVIVAGRFGVASRDFPAKKDHLSQKEAMKALGPKAVPFERVKDMTIEWLNAWAKKSGAHVYAGPGNVLYIGNGVAYVQARTNDVTIDFGEEVFLIDPRTREKSDPLRYWTPDIAPGKAVLRLYLPVSCNANVYL